VLDLAYAEDSVADADVNVVATSAGELIEVQGTAEGRPFSRADFDRVLELAMRGIAQLIEAQNNALKK
jgi:ribonuclease PH